MCNMLACVAVYMYICSIRSVIYTCFLKMVRTRVNKGKCVDFLSKTKQFDWIKELFILIEQNLIPLLTMNERENLYVFV